MRLTWKSTILICSHVFLVHAAYAGDAAPAKPSSAGIHSLAEFGPVENQLQIQETYAKAVQALRAQKGGVLTVPAAVWASLKPVPLQGLIRTPAAPAETKQWNDSPGVTVLAVDPQKVVIDVPPLTGMQITRRLRLADGDSLPHWGTHPAVTIDSNIVYGSISYLDWLQAPVEKGKDRRFYLPTVRGLRPGHFINIHGGPGYGGGVTRAAIKSLGYDDEKKMHYLVADTELNHVAGAILQNKSNTGLVHMTQTSNNDNQTYDMKIIRNQYAHGDTYMFYADFNYMSNVHSAAGDENGNVFSAFVRSMDNNFRGKVETVDWSKNQLKFSPSAQNVATLGDSRPMINRNPRKAITAGKVIVVAPSDYVRPTEMYKANYGHRPYPTRGVTHPRTGNTELKIGGLIRGDKDCPWTPEVIGRFFALNFPGEKTPMGDHRWYQITDLRVNADGTKDIEIMRYWWGAKSAGAPLLYDFENYTWDGHVKPLEYIIAPGTFVNDVSRAIPGDDRGGQRIVGVAPYNDQAKAFDFEAGDDIEQAIGPDPFKPQPFRSYIWEDVPGSWPSAIFDVANWGNTSRYAALAVSGGPSTLEEAKKRHEPKPAWDNVVVVDSAAGVGLNLKADFDQAAILFQQPNHEQPIKWYYQGKNGLPREAALTVSKSTGELNYAGGGVSVNGSVSTVAGISGDVKPAQNLRGKNIAVTRNAKTFDVRFPKPEADGDYAVFIEQSWLGQRAISNKTANGFTITFSDGAPENATIDWMIVR